jgi:hypothetical protein
MNRNEPSGRIAGMIKRKVTQYAAGSKGIKWISFNPLRRKWNQNGN